MYFAEFVFGDLLNWVERAIVAYSMFPATIPFRNMLTRMKEMAVNFEMGLLCVLSSLRVVRGAGKLVGLALSWTLLIGLCILKDFT